MNIEEKDNTIKKNTLKSITKIAKNKEDNIGLSIIDGQISITLPQGYTLDDKEEKEVRSEIIDIMILMEKYKNKMNKSNNFNEETNDVHKEEGDHFPFSSYLFILKYYLSHGIYKEKQSTYKRSKSMKNTSFQRTFKAVRPLYNENDEPVYTEFINKVNNYNEDLIITEIFKYTLHESINTVGAIIYPHLKNINLKRRYPNKFCIAFLRKKLRSTNLDLNKQLFKNMINIFKGNNNDALKHNEFTIKRVEYLFEVMIDDVFANKNASEINKDNKARWHIKDKAYDSSNARIDSIYVDENKVIIMDAKYYQYGFTDNIQHLPNTADIRKQISYANYIKNNEKLNIKDKALSNISNVFLLPTDKENTYMGHAVYQKEKVQSYLINLKQLIRNYIKKEFDLNIELLREN